MVMSVHKTNEDPHLSYICMNNKYVENIIHHSILLNFIRKKREVFLNVYVWIYVTASNINNQVEKSSVFGKLFS